MTYQAPLPHLLVLLLWSALTGSVPFNSASAAEPLAEFVESRGCRLLASPNAVARLREIASQGSVTWDGACRNGLIEGNGILRHEGRVAEKEKIRHYAFYLSGSAGKGVRQGTWRREAFNMFETSTRYWTSLGTITYVDGLAKGAPKLLEARSNADFSASFRAFLASVDQSLAAAAAQVPPPSAVAPDASTRSASTAPIAIPQTTRPGVADTTSAKAAASVQAAPERIDSSAGAGAPRFQGSGLGPGGASGLRLGPAVPLPAAPAQEILEQSAACYVDTINDTVIRAEAIIAPAGEQLRITGWAADPRAPRIPEKAWVRLYDRGGGPGLMLEMPRNVDRPDVAKAMGSQLYAKSGFSLVIEPGRTTPGEYTVAIVQQLGDVLAVCTAVGRLSLR